MAYFVDVIFSVLCLDVTCVKFGGLVLVDETWDKEFVVGCWTHYSHN